MTVGSRWLGLWRVNDCDCDCGESLAITVWSRWLWGAAGCDCGESLAVTVGSRWL